MPFLHSAYVQTGALGRLFLFALVLVFAPLATASDACSIPDGTTRAEVRRVVDGDTLLLVDGERVRMVGLDAPELGRRGATDAPLARPARRHLETLVQLASGVVLLHIGEEPRDRYGRLLAVVYTERHGDLAAHLIGNGLALVAPVPPISHGLACWLAAEAAARSAGAGLWALQPGPVIPAASVDDTGFAIVSGRTGDWVQRRGDRLLRLDGAVVLRFRAADIERWFGGFPLDELTGRYVEVRGWVHPWGRDGRAITVQHPVSIEIID